MIISSRLLQEEKASLSIIVTESGIFTYLSFLALEHVLSHIFVVPCSNSTVTRPLASNGAFPTISREAGKVMLYKLSQLANA